LFGHKKTRQHHVDGLYFGLISSRNSWIAIAFQKPFWIIVVCTIRSKVIILSKKMGMGHWLIKRVVDTTSLWLTTPQYGTCRLRLVLPVTTAHRHDVIAVAVLTGHFDKLHLPVALVTPALEQKLGQKRRDLLVPFNLNGSFRFISPHFNVTFDSLGQDKVECFGTNDFRHGITHGIFSFQYVWGMKLLSKSARVSNAALPFRQSS
jgi:hypothetical protein